MHHLATIHNTTDDRRTQHYSISNERYCSQLTVDRIITGHHKNRDTIGKQKYQELGSGLNFEFFQF